MHIPIDLIPHEFSVQYNLYEKVTNGHVYIQIEKGMYGLPWAGILANKLFQENSTPRILQGSPYTRPVETHNKTCPVHFGC